MRLNRKKFDNAYDRCWVSVPKSDRTFKNGMDHPEIKEDILNLYRYKCTGKCTAKFRRWLEAVLRRHSDPELAVITGINLRYDDFELSGDMGHNLSYRTTRLIGVNREQYEGCAGAFLCKITDAEAVKKYAPEIRKAFITHGFTDRGEDEGEEEIG